ncbi:MAG: D-alanyl-D-alanine carboxypeptidase family protein [Bacilli bacterium]
MKKIYLILLIFSLFILNVNAKEDYAPTAKSAILVDNATGKVLFEKNADERLAPASMTKLGSMLLIMEAIDSGKISLDDEVTISEEAASMGGSQVFLEAGEVYKVHDLLKGVAIASGNDAVVALAEKIAGSQSEFVDAMNKRFKEIGATNTNFVNAHGLDTENHYSTARDMSIIARELLKHERILEYTSIYEEYLEKNDGTKTWLVNTNKLVRFYNGVDGLKTGFTENAGYCLTATAKKDNFRLISVVMGEDSTENRSSDTVKMLNYGFNTFKVNIIKTNDEILGKVRVEGGKENYADIVLLNDATELLKNTDDISKYEFILKVDTIKAPVKKGDIVGSAEIIDNEGNIVDEVDVTVNKDILKANLFDYILRNFKMFARGKDIIKQK